MYDNIKQLELSLLDQDIRKNKKILSEIISEEFVEIGSSGKIYKKIDILKYLPEEKDHKFTMIDFEYKELSKDVILVYYKITEDNSLRSSIWKKYSNKWKIIFHQGTKI